MKFQNILNLTIFVAIAFTHEEIIYLIRFQWENQKLFPKQLNTEKIWYASKSEWVVWDEENVVSRDECQIELLPNRRKYVKRFLNSSPMEICYGNCKTLSVKYSMRINSKWWQMCSHFMKWKLKFERIPTSSSTWKSVINYCKGESIIYFNSQPNLSPDLDVMENSLNLPRNNDRCP